MLDWRVTRKVKVDQYARARHAWLLLVDQARTHSPPFTYQELCSELRVPRRAAMWFLRIIQHYCDREGLPKLQGLVVSGGTGCLALAIMD
jgi:hypothetical protein